MKLYTVRDGPSKADVTDTHPRVQICNGMRQSLKEPILTSFSSKFSIAWIQIMNQRAWSLLLSSLTGLTHQLQRKKLQTEWGCLSWGKKVGRTAVQVQETRGPRNCHLTVPSQDSSPTNSHEERNSYSRSRAETQKCSPRTPQGGNFVSTLGKSIIFKGISFFVLPSSWPVRMWTAKSRQTSQDPVAAECGCSPAKMLPMTLLSKSCRGG